MNRKQRRALKKSKKPNKEKIYNLKESEIVKAVVNGAGKEKMRREINRQLLQANKQYMIDLDTTVLWTLHSEYGFGAKRLKEFYIKMFTNHLEMRNFYGLDDLYPERYKLKQIGVDVEKWYEELFNDDGSFKVTEELAV